MTITEIICPVLYATDVFFCVLAIRKENKLMYGLTKVLLMPLLLLTYLFFLPNELSTAGYQIFVILALACHAIGDALLLIPRSKSKYPLYAGTLFFLIGHIFYILWFAKAPFEKLTGVVFVLIPVFIVSELILLKKHKKETSKYAIPILLYSLGLGLLFVEVLRMIVNPFAVVSLVGVILFIFSDYCIARREIGKPVAGQIVIMPTYIAGQTLIILGMYLIQTIK